ncbi:MAG: transporter substrate-binding domain-containing protein [Collinsella intestinalis]
MKLSGMAALSVGGMMFLAGCGPAPQGSGDAADDGASASGTLLGDGKTLRVGMEAAYAPYNWQVSEESEFTIPIENVPGAYADGYDVQVAKIIADGLGMEPVAVKLEFGSLIDALNNGQVDIVCAGMSVTPERAAAAAFSDSYVDDDIVMICRADLRLCRRHHVRRACGCLHSGPGRNHVRRRYRPNRGCQPHDARRDPAHGC